MLSCHKVIGFIEYFRYTQIILPLRDIGEYLNKPNTRKLIGVDPSLPANVTGCAWDVRERFRMTQDHTNPTQYYIGALLDRGVRVLIYVGENDWMCNWVRSSDKLCIHHSDSGIEVANERTSLELDWHGQSDFRRESLRSWIHNGRVAGKTRGTGLLVFATISGAGHMVCMLTTVPTRPQLIFSS
jgi:carboxypeptidase C (cathepsin A)